MKLAPRNRYILLGEIPKDNNEDQPTILLPEEYTAKVNPYNVYQIQQISVDCATLSFDDIGRLAVVNDSMVETINVDQGEFLFILENYIYGVLEN